MRHVHVGPPGFLIDTGKDVLRHERLRSQIRDAAVGIALEPIQIAVARRLEQALRCCAVRLEIHQHRRIHFVPSQICPMVLEIALDLAGVAVKRERRRRVQIVARPLIAEPRRGVAGAPVDRVAVGIVVAGHPSGGAAGLPSVSFLPRITARLARRRNAIGLPHRLAGLGIKRLDEAAHAELTASDADQHFALNDERGHGRVVALLPILDLRFPSDFAGLGIESDHHGIERSEVNLVSVERHAAVGVVQCP